MKAATQMNKTTIKKASVKEIEFAFIDLAIRRVSLFMIEPAKENNRKIELLEAMGNELLRRKEEGAGAILRLASHPDSQVRVSISPTLILVDREKGLELLRDLTSDPIPKVGLEAQVILDFDKYR